jgi:hypothetical protein
MGRDQSAGIGALAKPVPAPPGASLFEMKSTKSISQSDTRIEQQSTQGKKNDDAVKAQCSPATKFLITERLKTRLGRFVDANEFMDRACDGDCSFKFRDRDFVFAGSMLKPIYHFVVVSLRELLPHNAK